MRSSRSGLRVRLCATALAVALVLPGCRSVGVGASWLYDWGAGTFAPNPASVGFYYLGLGVSFVVTAPLILLNWPLVALTYPEEEEAFYTWSLVAPAHYLGVVVGTALAAPLYPFGWLWVPADPEPPPGPDAPPPGGE